MNQQDRRTDVGGGGETAAMPVNARSVLDSLIARLHREVRTDTEWLRLVADALAAERDRADRAEARAVVCEHQSDNYLTMMRERDAARQMIADAPHSPWCMTSIADVHARLNGSARECDCWKAGL